MGLIHCVGLLCRRCLPLGCCEPASVTYNLPSSCTVTLIGRPFCDPSCKRCTSLWCDFPSQLQTSCCQYPTCHPCYLTTLLIIIILCHNNIRTPFDILAIYTYVLTTLLLLTTSYGVHDLSKLT